MLIFVAGWGLLRVVNPFKDAASSFYGLMAFLIAVLLVLSGKVVRIITTATPWLIVIGMIGFFFIFFSRMFGVSEDTISGAFKDRGVGWLIFFVALVIVFAIGTSFGQDLLSAQTPTQTNPNTNVTYLPDGTTVVSTDPGSVVGSGTASSDFGRNLVLTIFHPKILGVLFLFILGTLTILLLNLGGGEKGGGGGGGGAGH